MKAHTIEGGDGLALHVHEAGNPNGKAILFVHGFCQSGLAWRKQLDSELARDFRLVAMDLRGHGQSDKPRGAYGESRLWADDVNAVVSGLQIDRPVLCAWSYGGAVLTDYVGRYGEDAIAGTHWVGAISRLGPPLVDAGFLGPDFMALVPALCAEDGAEASADALQRLLRACFHEEPPIEDLYLFLGYNALVPPHIRRDLLARDLDNDDVIRAMRRPVLVTYGERDRIVMPAMARHIASLARQARISAYSDVGHAPFWEAPERFNRELAEFRAGV